MLNQLEFQKYYQFDSQHLIISMYKRKTQQFWLTFQFVDKFGCVNKLYNQGQFMQINNKLMKEYLNIFINIHHANIMFFNEVKISFTIENKFNINDMMIRNSSELSFYIKELNGQGLLKNKHRITVMNCMLKEFSLIKNFAFENQLTGKVHHESIRLFYIPNVESINLTQSLKNTFPIDHIIGNSLLFFVDYDKKMDIYLGSYPQQQIFIMQENLLDDIIRLRYKPLTIEIQGKLNNSQTKKKIKQRTIKEAIQGVKQWITFYNLIDQRGNKVHTLQSASHIVGISKKTLDDYYKHIKLASEHNFDFQRHQASRVGVLRSFIRDIHAQSCRDKKQLRIDPEMFWALPVESQEHKCA